MFRRQFHLKRVPKLYCHGIKQLDLVSSIPTTDLLVKLNFIHQPRSGLFNYLPMGLGVLDKLKGVIDESMTRANFDKVQLGLLSLLESWRTTGRYNNPELYKVRGAGGTKDDYVLLATAEEDMTQLIKLFAFASPKEYPVLVYQINDKFRDELRPRGGLLRGKEFVMKDGYSFDIDEPLAMKSYKTVTEAYHRIFKALKTPYVVADADTGDIGGSLSHEWHYLHPTGGDTVFTCTNCGNVSNVEKTLSYAEVTEESAKTTEVGVKYFITKDDKTLVCVYYPLQRQLQESFVALEVPDIDLSNRLSQEEILAIFSDKDQLIDKRIVRLMDARLNHRSPLPDFPVPFISRSLISTLFDVPLVSAEEGDICAVCDEGTLQPAKAIEIGHTFYLGDKYSSSLGLTIDSKSVQMGCYGIGLLRIVAALGEIHRDGKGLRWPRVIAPWDATLIDIRKNVGGDHYSENHDVVQLCKQLESNGIDYRLDDRSKYRLGSKVHHSNLVGIPLVIILGKRFPQYVEIETRYTTSMEHWKHLYEHQHTFHWEVEQDGDGNVHKHTVALEGAIQVIEALLEDM